MNTRNQKIERKKVKGDPTLVFQPSICHKPELELEEKEKEEKEKVD